MGNITKNEFKYARLLRPETGEYVTEAPAEDLVMGPETARRYNENEDDCAVTVCCITYKHEEYIAQALESFVRQKTNFRYRVFVGEDRGGDGTADIVLEYAKKYPDIIVPFIREQNMGAQANLIDLCSRANSPYIAFCEGDDYWTDEYKLQKQFDYMQANEDKRICFTRVEISAPEDWFLNKWFKPDRTGRLIFPECEPAYKKTKMTVDCRDCVWVFPAHTSSVFYRWNYDLTYPDWYFTGIIGDHPLFLMQLGEGKAQMLPDVTSVYRRSNVGVFMSDNMDEYFLKTRIDHVRWISGMLDWYEENQPKNPWVPFQNRLKHESYNYLKTLIKVDDYDAVIDFFKNFPRAGKVGLKAYLSFYRDSQTLINAFTWPAYSKITNKKRYRYALRPYGKAVILCEKMLGLAKKALKAVKNAVAWVCYWAFTLVPKKKDRWVITAYRGKGYFDNAKYFYEYILEHHPEIDIVWLTRDPEVLRQLSEEGRPVLPFRSLRGIWCGARANILVTDHNGMSDFSSLYGYNDRTKVIQLWHGVGFKSMGDEKEVKTVQWPGVQYSRDILPMPGDSLAKRAVKRVRYFFTAYHRELFERYFMFVCPGQERVDMIAKVWSIPMERCFMAGHPRDIYSYSLRPDPAHPKVMYAPTFRYESAKEVALIEDCVAAFPAIQALMERVDGTFVLRLHPHTWRDYSSMIKNAMRNYDRIVQDTEKDVYTSLGTYNVMISDYSSISMDFAVLDRPTVYYCPDIDWFRKTQAGFNLDFENMIPGPLAKDWEEIVAKTEAYLADPTLDGEMRRTRSAYFFDPAVNGPDNSERIIQEAFRRLEAGEGKR